MKKKLSFILNTLNECTNCILVIGCVFVIITTIAAGYSLKNADTLFKCQCNCYLEKN